MYCSVTSDNYYNIYCGLIQILLKIKLFLRLITYKAIKTCKGVEYLEVTGGLIPWPLYPWGRRTRYPVDGKLAGATTGLDAGRKRTPHSRPEPNIKPQESPTAAQSSGILLALFLYVTLHFL
jgi:hypothetical protein